MDNVPADPLYTLRDIPGKGKGLIALTLITRGTRILSEPPLITIPTSTLSIPNLQNSILHQVSSLSIDQRAAFLSLHNTYSRENENESARYLGICRTNALPASTYPNDTASIFLTASRLNHSCLNNTQKHWNETTKQHTVHALRDTPPGEELTICYLSIIHSRAIRRAALSEKFHFLCQCTPCALPAEQSKESDARLEELLELDEQTARLGVMGMIQAPLRMLRGVERQVKLYDEQGPGDAGLPRAFLDAAQVLIANGDLARARGFLKRAVEGWRVSRGEDCGEVSRFGELVEDPKTHELYGLSMRWKTEVGDAPVRFSDTDFEDWLWRREKAQPPGQKMSLRHCTTFPAFSELPGEYDVDLDFYQSTWRPRRHWCFLGEIVDFGFLARLQMDLKDVDGQTVPLFFYTEGRGQEIAPSVLRKGFTVCILYAQRYAFLFSEPGIRHEIPERMKIIPLSLQELLALTDHIGIYSSVTDGNRRCHSCDKMGRSMKVCVRCKCFWYCDKVCQEVGWKEKGHKKDCRILKDPDLREIFAFQWDDFEAYTSFPLPRTLNSSAGGDR